MDRLSNEGSCEAFHEAATRFVGCVSGLSKGEVLRRIFSFMKKDYRNEYVYKSLLLKKIVYGRHSPRTTSAICELPVRDSIADFVLINGKACAYEIKTDLDNLHRLPTQIADYYRAFRYVSVVCSEDMSANALELLKELPVGVMVLTDRLTFRTLVEPRCWTRDIDPFVQFDLLRKRERERVLRLCGIELPNTTQVEYYSACLERFEKLDACYRQDAFERTLKERGAKVNQAALALYPEEFRLVAYNHGASVDQAVKLNEFAQSMM